MKVVGNDGLRRTSKPDLIGHHHSVTLLTKHIDSSRPVLAEEIHAMKQNYRATVSLSFRRDIHVSHAHILTVHRHRKVRHRVGIWNVIQGDAAGFDVGRRWRRLSLTSFLRKSRLRTDDTEQNETRSRGQNRDAPPSLSIPFKVRAVSANFGLVYLRHESHLPASIVREAATDANQIPIEALSGRPRLVRSLCLPSSSSRL